MSKQSSTPTFAQLGVAIEITDALDSFGIQHTFAIQELTLPLALDGIDLIGQARTGQGKTLGFGVPLLDRIFDSADIAELDGTPRALVVTPTRELAIQVADDLHRAAKNLPVRILTIYGGRPYEEQINALDKGIDVVVGTPGRLLDLYQRGSLTPIEKLLKALTHKHQTMLFSATMPGPIVTLARTFMHKPVHIRAEEPDAAQTNQDIRQVVFQAHRMDKVAVVSRILQAQGRGKTIIFARTKRSAAELANDLAASGFLVGAVHGDMGQPAREKSLTAFRSGDIEILVATDVAARGIDIDDVTHVINYQTPDDEMTYVHRIGRTGRAGHTGTAVTLVGYDELPKWQLINSELNLDNPEPPQWFSTSPELFDALDIPESASATVGPARKVFGGAMVTRPAQARSLARGGRKEGRSGRRKADPRRRS